jgi:hypothetical protein
MGEIDKINIKNVTQSVLSIVLGGIIMLIMQASFTDTQQVRDDIIALDKKKADIEYVDKKARELKSDRLSSDAEFSNKLDNLTNKTDRILELMIKQK